MQEQVDAGLLTPEQARVHPYSNVITRCVGASVDVVPDIYFGALQTGRRAAAGVGRPHRHARGRAAGADPRREGDPQGWVDRMITEANRRGGLDNITAIVVRIDAVGNTGEHPTAVAAAGEQSSAKPALQPDVGPREPFVLQRHPQEAMLLVSRIAVVSTVFDTMTTFVAPACLAKSTVASITDRRTRDLAPPGSPPSWRSRTRRAREE